MPHPCWLQLIVPATFANRRFLRGFILSGMRGSLQNAESQRDAESQVQPVLCVLCVLCVLSFGLVAVDTLRPLTVGHLFLLAASAMGALQ